MEREREGTRGSALGKRLEIWTAGSEPVGGGVLGEKNLEAKYQKIAIRIIP